jgi:hypothetical protein
MDKGLISSSYHLKDKLNHTNPKELVVAIVKDTS